MMTDVNIYRIPISDFDQYEFAPFTTFSPNPNMEAKEVFVSGLHEEHPLYPFHMARVSSDNEYAGEIPRLRPDFVCELDKNGFSPLQKAAAAGQVEVVRGILGIDRELCRLKGRDGTSPLHVAAIKGRVDVIREMLLSCADCVEDTTAQGQTALHLAVQHHRYEAVDAMVEMIRESKRDHVLNEKDEQGNTPLHLAAWRKQRQVVETLLRAKPVESSPPVEVNAVNKMDLTALDLLLMFPSEAGDREIYEILIKAGAQRGKDCITIATTTPQGQEPTQLDLMSKRDDLLEFFSFKRNRDSPSEARSALLVVASLVATATFQASLSPPGGTWQDTFIGGGLQNKTAVDQITHKAGQSIMGTFDGISFALFVFFNSIGFSVSLSMINILTRGFPLQFELQVCMLAMFFSQNTAMVSIAPDHVKLYCILITSIVSAASPFLTKLLQPPLRKLVKLVCFMFRKIF